jgi:hypothetical protein
MFLGNTAAALQVLPACSPGWTVLGGTVTPNPVNFPINTGWRPHTSDKPVVWTDH